MGALTTAGKTVTKNVDEILTMQRYRRSTTPYLPSYPPAGQPGRESG